MSKAMAEEEMTLDEYVGVLPSGHRAHVELKRLKFRQNGVPRDVVDRLCDVIISFARDAVAAKMSIK